MADKLKIKVKDNGKMDVEEALQNPGNDPKPEIKLPSGAVLHDACIVFTTNPQTCAWCLQNGQWKRMCW